jgi:predicted dehydrogenase
LTFEINHTQKENKIKIARKAWFKGEHSMKNSFSGCDKPSGPRLVGRREFLETALGAGLATTVGNAQNSRKFSANSELRVGLIGRDGHAEILLDSIPKLQNVKWTAYAKSEPCEDNTWVQKHPAASGEVRVYDTYQEMLEKQSLDVVGVCLPFYQNAEASIQAARKGIHVLSEKPAATNLQDLARLEAAISQSGVRYSIMLNMRAMPIFQAARQAVRQGAIGEPILISSQKSYKYGSERPWFYKDIKTYGGTIPWIGIHALDYMRWVSGLEYSQVAAFEGNKAHPQAPGCEDHAAMLFQLANGGSATCHLDFLRPEAAPTHGDDRLRIAGSEGVLEVLEVGNRVSLINSKGHAGELPLPASVDFFSTFIAELRGVGQHLITAEEAFSITRVCLNARDAADTGQWVKL